MSKKTEIFTSHGAAFLDPASVGSSVRYEMKAHRYEYKRDGREPKVTFDYEMTVELRDCDRTVRWGLWTDHGDQSLTNMRLKLDVAISVLKEARRKIEEMADVVQKAEGGERP